MRMRLPILVLLASSLAACTASSPDANDVDPGDPEADSSAQTTSASCKRDDAALFFHGMNGYGRDLGGGGICAPAITDGGATGFWSGVANVPAPGARVVGGYSAGRVPLVRRLEKGTGEEQTAVMLDGSWSDGARFDGRTGPDIVKAWLQADRERRFVLVYLTSSAGWREYKALETSAVADQVTSCAVSGVSHFDLPHLVGKNLFLDPDAWLAERCIDGKVTAR